MKQAAIEAGGDGIKSTNTTDEAKGFVYIVNGNFAITAGFDGIQAETKLLIEDGSFEIETGGGSTNTSSTTETWGTWGHPTAHNTTGNTAATSDSAKGLKAGNNLIVTGGEFNLDCSDDAIHSNQDVGIKDGAITIKTGDDAIHADRALILDGGDIVITQSYEGLEGTTVTISGGEISLVTTDDGINAAGGSDASSTNNGRPGANNFTANSQAYIRITGGTIVVDATGDGIDSNGNIYIDGGDITVYGPTNGADGALDYDGDLKITGGILRAGGASGMAQGIGKDSTINGVMIFFSQTMSNNDEITIIDESGNIVMSYKSSKNYNSLTVATTELQTGQTYKVMVNSDTYSEFTITDTVTQIGSGGLMSPGKNGNMPAKGEMRR